MARSFAGTSAASWMPPNSRQTSKDGRPQWRAHARLIEGGGCWCWRKVGLFKTLRGCGRVWWSEYGNRLIWLAGDINLTVKSRQVHVEVKQPRR